MKTLFVTTCLLLSLLTAKAQPTQIIQNITQCPLVVTELCYTVGTPCSFTRSYASLIPPGGGMYKYGGCSGSYPAYEVCWSTAPPSCSSNANTCVIISAAPALVACGITANATLPNECPFCTPHTGSMGADVSINPTTGEIIVNRIP